MRAKIKKINYGTPKFSEELRQLSVLYELETGEEHWANIPLVWDSEGKQQFGHFQVLNLLRQVAVEAIVDMEPDTYNGEVRGYKFTRPDTNTPAPAAAPAASGTEQLATAFDAKEVV